MHSSGGPLQAKYNEIFFLHFSLCVKGPRIFQGESSGDSYVLDPVIL